MNLCPPGLSNRIIVPYLFLQDDLEPIPKIDRVYVVRGFVHK